MVRRKALIKRIATEARRQGVPWILVREGANHSIYRLGPVMIPIPRHNEIVDNSVVDVFKECQDIFGRGWWRR